MTALLIVTFVLIIPVALVLDAWDQIRDRLGR